MDIQQECSCHDTSASVSQFLDQRLSLLPAIQAISCVRVDESSNKRYVHYLWHHIRSIADQWIRRAHQGNRACWLLKCPLRWSVQHYRDQKDVLTSTMSKAQGHRSELSAMLLWAWIQKGLFKLRIRGWQHLNWLVSCAWLKLWKLHRHQQSDLPFDAHRTTTHEALTFSSFCYVRCLAV